MAEQFAVVEISTNLIFKTKRHQKIRLMSDVNITGIYFDSEEKFMHIGFTFSKEKTRDYLIRFIKDGETFKPKGKMIFSTMHQLKNNDGILIIIEKL